MKLSAESVTFSNFLTFGKVPQTLKFEPGINIITGLDYKTERSNGSGKSSAVETIPFSLFGRINKSIRKENIINWKNKKNCWVSFKFTKGDNEYEIKRGIKPDFLEITENGKTIPAPSDVRIFQKTLENEILQIDYYSFQSLCSINLNNYIPILKMDSVKKRQFLERVFGLEAFSILNDKANKKLKITEDSIYKNKLNQETKVKIKNDLIEQNVTLQKQIDKMYQSNVLLNDDLALLNDIFEKHSNPEEKLKELTNEYEGLIIELNTLITDYEQLKKLEKTRLFDLIDTKEKDIDEKIKENNKNLTKLSNKIAVSKEKISQLKKNLKAIEGKSECPTCGGVIKGNYNETIKSEISKYEDILKNDNAEHKELSKVITDVREEREKLKIQRKKFSINDIETERIKKLNEKIEHLNVRKNILLEEIKEMKGIVNNLLSLKSRIDILKEQVKKEKEAREGIQRVINSNLIKINELDTHYKSIDGTVKRLNELTDYMEYVKLICKDENIKQFAISSIIPYLTKQTNHYMSDIGSNFYIRFDNWLDETIEGPGIYNCTYGSLSGAESKAVDLAIQFAFLDIARIQAGLFPDILILDELLDSSVDGTGLSNILNVIKRRQTDDNSKVFLITHRKEVNEIDADRIYFVEKKDGYSYLNTVTNR